MRILVVDDHPVFRRGLIEALGDDASLVVCAEAADISGALDAAVRHRPDVAIVDLSLGGESGLALIPRLVATGVGVRILVMSAHDERVHADRAMQAGALGYVMKDGAIREVIAAVHRVARGRPSVSPEVAERLLLGLGNGRASKARSPLDRLSNREREILTLMGEGRSTRQIAVMLGISGKTVETHCAHIKAKLGLRNGRELMRTAVMWFEHDLV